jgi:hypothetical protein
MAQRNLPTHVRARAAPARLAALVACLALGSLSSCIATPIPDPPSLDVSRMSLQASRDGSVRLSGEAGAARVGGRALRVSNVREPAIPSRATVLVAEDGSFVARLLGGPADVLYLETIGPRDVYELAVRREGSRVVTADPGGDQDRDGSPDAIDCAPDDATLSGNRCGLASCAMGVDCAVGQDCIDTVCVVAGCARAETCGNGLDDDCDGIADGGCTAPCASSDDCVTGEACISNECTVLPCNVESECGALEQCAVGVCSPEACAGDAECAPGQECSMGVCRPAACAADVDCGPGLVCRAGGCVAPACTTDADCGSAFRCESRACVLATCTDPRPCGMPGAVCAAGQVCVEDVCTEACAMGRVCRLGLCR